MTNGDRFKKEIAKKSNDELADILMGSVCEYCIHDGKNCGKKPCKAGIKSWFNTPCKENPPADNEPQEVIPAEVRVDLRKVAKEIVGECAVDKSTSVDNVNHPSHYTFGKIEVIDFIEDKKLGFHLGNAVKYISRAGRKDPAKTVEDLRKAAWYLNRQIERLEREQ